MTEVDISREILRNILTIIEYQEDKEKFIDEFLDSCYHRALVELSETLPEQEKNILVKKLSTEIDEEKIRELVKPYITMPEYVDLVNKVSQEILIEKLGPFIKNLTEDKKNLMKEYFKKNYPLT